MKEIELNIQKFAGNENIMMGPSGTMEGHIHWESTVYGSTPAEKASLNKSHVKALIYVHRTDGSYTQGDFTGYLTVAGTTSNINTNKYVSSDWVLLTTVEVDVPHNADGTKSIVISGKINGPSGTTWSGVSVSVTATRSLDTIPRYFTNTPVVSTASTTTTGATFNWSTSETCSAVKYILDGGSQVSAWTGSASSGSFSVSGLTANTSHTMKIYAQRKDSGLWSYSNQISFTTSNKTVRIRVNGTWKNATPYVRVNGQWKVAVPYTRVNGQWKKGI